jgi:hypothetical protein
MRPVAWLIKLQLKPVKDTAEVIEQLPAAEQPGSELVRALTMQGTHGRASRIRVARKPCRQ